MIMFFIYYTLTYPYYWVIFVCYQRPRVFKIELFPENAKSLNYN